MSSYADITDLTRYGLPETALADLDPEAVQGTLDAASSTADSYFANRFPIPYPNPGTDLVDAVCRIAAFNIMATRGYNPDGDAGQLRLRYEDAIRWLEQVAAEKVTPANAAQAAGGESLADFATYSSRSLRGW